MFSRDHELYKKYLFRGRWQPYIAIFGAFGTSFVVAFSGVPAIYLLCVRDRLKTRDDVKKNGLIADVLGAYSAVSLRFPSACCFIVAKGL